MERTMSAPEWVETISKLGSLGIAIVGAIYAWWQYRQNKRGKEVDLAQSILNRLNSDDEIFLACQALDWGVGPLIVPARYRALFQTDPANPSTAVHKMDHDPALLCLAVEQKLNPAVLADVRGLVYRYCFIKFLSYLDNAYQLIEARQLRPNDVQDLKYWIDKLRDYPYAPGIPGVAVFQPTLHGWGYDNVIALGGLLGVNRWESYAPNGVAVAGRVDEKRDCCADPKAP
jgi:hypothetical protein